MNKAAMSETVKRAALVLAVSVGAFGVGCCSSGGGAQAAPPRRPAPADAEPSATPSKVVPGEYLFSVAPGTDQKVLSELLLDLAPTRVLDLGGNTVLVTFGEDPGLARLLLRVGDGPIRAVQPNYVYRGSAPAPRR